ncbi:putative phage replisome organizer [Psychrobacillus insolitus]|uniref:Putative phage replisome organizer n=1 Tax=Psychrobacillus insolitus TaxID=1461 RepID=A0A2W7MRX5_9BACI|nr:phage replisome organizer N-terminal domain-containing protein [Psychrobacillus insolitus]PZX07934.1 putative phage replisome organizer [Psychrobacillus insolitus]
MSEITWIKLKTDMFDNQKIRLIEALPEGDTILVIWIKLLTYAGRTNANGFILINEDIALTVEEMAIIFNRQLNVVRLALEAFKRYGMISMHNEIVRIKNWDVHQNIEGMERAKQLNAERNRKYRERKKLELPAVAQQSDVSVTSRDETDIDLDLELELDKEKDIKNKDIRDLFNHYNSKNIIQHKNLNSSIKTAIASRLKDYSYEQLVQAIDNYAIVYSSEDYWFTTKYALADLMRDKDVRKFINDAEPLKNFVANRSFGGKTNGRQGTNQAAGKQYADGLNF